MLEKQELERQRLLLCLLNRLVKLPPAVEFKRYLILFFAPTVHLVNQEQFILLIKHAVRFNKSISVNANVLMHVFHNIKKGFFSVLFYS